MALYTNGSSSSAAYVGSQPVRRMYLGSVRIWSTNSGVNRTEPAPLFAAGGLLSEAEATFQSLGNWSVGDFTQTVGGLESLSAIGTNTNVMYTGSFPGGSLWVLADFQRLTGNIRIQTNEETAASNIRSASHVENFTATTVSQVGFLANNAFAGTVRRLQVFDMNEVLANPCDVYISAGQSLLATQATSLPIDTSLGDSWRDKRCLVIRPQDGAVLQAATIPFQSQVNEAQGVTPAHSFQATMLEVTSSDRNIVIVQTAVGGTSLVGSDAEWNPDGVDGDGAIYYDGMVSIVQSTMAALPNGSQLKGMLWSQGQADNSVNFGTIYPPAFANLVTNLRADIGVSDLPIAILGPNRDNSNWDLMHTTQSLLDKDSGDSTAIPNVIYVAGPTGYDEDGTHITAAGSRIHGAATAEAWITRFLSGEGSVADALQYNGENLTYNSEIITYG